MPSSPPKRKTFILPLYWADVRPLVVSVPLPGRMYLASLVSKSPKQKRPPNSWGPLANPGDDLLSHTVSGAVSSALEGLTSVFGMATGVSPPLQSPETRETSFRSSSGALSAQILGLSRQLQRRKF